MFRDANGQQHIDPIFAAIERARFATRQANARVGDPADKGGSPEARAAEEEVARRVVREDHAYQDVFKLRPTTREGLFALIDYARERGDFQTQMAENAGEPRADGGVFPAAPDVLGAIRDGAAMLLDGVREVVAPDPVFEAALPATSRVTRHAKALAAAWFEHLDAWMTVPANGGRDEAEIGERMGFDIQTALAAAEA